MARLVFLFACAEFVVFLCGPAVRAQNTDSGTDSAPSQATAPYPPMVSWASSAEAPMDSEQLAPDQRPLTGAQGLTLGQYSEPQSYLLPSVIATTQLGTNLAGSGYSGVSSVSFLLGRLDLHHLSGRSQLDLNYLGGGMFSNYGDNGNAAIQDLEISDSIHWQRWTLFLGDEANYLPESSFGFGGVGGLGFLGGISQFGPGGLLGGSLPFLSTALTPSETIPTASIPRLSNTAVTQVGYQINPRSSWTAAVSYELLQFFGAGYIDSRSALFQTGYNYQVSPLSTIAVLYRFDAFRFTNLGVGIDDHAVELSYARRITGRLSFQIAGGAEMDVFRLPTAAYPNQISWTLSSSFNYQFVRTALSLGYDHLLTAGSGVLVGAETDQVQGSAVRNISQTWQVLLSLGYAHNRALPQTTAGAIQPVFNSWYGAVQVSHQLRPGMAFFFAYGAQTQGTNTASCTTFTCGTNSITNQFSLGFNWGLRPIALP
jgi:hypothetical protein